jgi:hypothetical protein
LARLLQETRSDAEVIDEFYLAVLSRRPDPDELDSNLLHVKNSGARAEGLADIVWALINSREFGTNH